MPRIVECGKYQIRTPVEYIEWDMREVEHAGRIAYRSESGQITNESAAKFIDMLIRRGHESVLEHGKVNVEFWDVSRGFSHELVRQRLASITQESTRYVDQSEMSMVLAPNEELNMTVTLEDGLVMTLGEMVNLYEHFYRGLRQSGKKQEDARQFLPIGLVTRLEFTANFREWRHVFRLRTDKAAHWEIREVMGRLLEDMKVVAEPVFKDFIRQGEDRNGVAYYGLVDRRTLVNE